MYLSLLHIDVGNNPSKLWLQNLYRVHQRLWMAFPTATQRIEDNFFLGTWNGPCIPGPKPQRRETGFLFRIEKNGHARILVQSAQQPDWEYAFQNAPYLLAGKPQIREFEPTPCCNQAYRFRLLANVVASKSVVHPNGKTRVTKAGLTFQCRRRIEVIIRPEPLPDPMPIDPIERQGLLLSRWDPWRDWLKGMGKNRGFYIDEKTNPLLMESIHAFVRSPNTEKRYNAGLFEGTLVCTEPELLRDAVINGVGHGKAYGFGLLSLLPA